MPTHAPEEAALVIVVPPELSCSQHKRELYAVDPYFRDAWDDCVDVWGYEEAIARLAVLAPVVFRPDALVARGVHRGLEALRQRGFTPVAHQTFRFSRMTVRELWRYQLNIATRDRLDVMDMILLATASLYVLMRPTAARQPDVPATTWLSSVKGPSAPRDRRPDHLRSLIAPAQVSVLTYIHIADEPADTVRELGIFLDRPQRLEVLRAASEIGDPLPPLERTIQQEYAGVPAHDLDNDRALARIAGAVRAAHHDHHQIAAGAFTELCEMCEGLRTGSREWRRLFALADATGLAIDLWDRVAVAGVRHDRHREGTPVLADVGLQDWEALKEHAAHHA